VVSDRRWLEGCYLSGDEFVSLLKFLKLKLKKDPGVSRGCQDLIRAPTYSMGIGSYLK